MLSHLSWAAGPAVGESVCAALTRKRITVAALAEEVLPGDKGFFTSTC